MQPGDVIWVKTLKADGTLHRRWRSVIEEVTPELIVAITRVGNPVYAAGKTYTQSFHIRNYYWPGYRHTLLEVYAPDGELVELYADVCSPVEILDSEIRFVDHELDVSHLMDGEPRLVDEDEFAEAAELYGYSEEFQQVCYQAAAEALALITGWQARGMPVD